MPIIRSSFSTRALPVRDQRAAWRAWFNPVFDLAGKPAEDAQPFPADIVSHAVGGVMLSRVVAPALHSVRHAPHIRRDPTDHWTITLGTGASRIMLPDGALKVPAGTPFLVSLVDPVESSRDSGERLHLYLPRDRFAAIAPLLDRARGRMLDGGLGQLLADYLRLLGRCMPTLTDAELPRLVDAIEAMVAACIAPGGGATDAAGRQIDLTQLERVRQAVRRRLRSATLTPASLCRDVGMSRSQLYRLMEGEGGVARYVQRQRLQASHAALSNPSDRRPIAAIAEACGFYDASIFSRSFRREFRVSPSDVRAAARAGLILERAWMPAMPAEVIGLGDCLRAL